MATESAVGREVGEPSEYLCANEFYRWSVWLDYAYWLNSMSREQRRAHDYAQAKWRQYVRLGCPAGFRYNDGEVYE